MRFAVWLTPTLAATALAGCSTMSEPTLPAVAAGAPSPMPGYDWHLNVNQTEASLTFGLADTDDVPLDLSCRPGSGTLQILQTVNTDHSHQISLESGGETQTYPAKGEPSAMHDGVDLTSVAKASDPVFLRFKTVGWLAVYGAAYRTPYVAQFGSAGQIERFLTLCSQE